MIRKSGTRTAISLVLLAVVLLLPVAMAQAQSAVEEWVKIYNGTGNGFDRAHAIAVDGSGNAYVTGQSWNGANNDYTTVKYDTNGNEKWAALYNGTGNATDYPYAIAVDGSGNAYVTGFASNGANDDYATVKYDTNGTEQWVKIYDVGNDTDAARAIAVDGSGNAYVTGCAWNAAGNFDYATVKYDTGGTQLWAAPYNGTGNGDDYACAIAVDGSSNAYVTGYSDNDYATVKYDTNGTELWVKIYDGTGNGDDRAQAIAVDGSGSAYVTGYARNAAGNDDYATIKYAVVPPAVTTNDATGLTTNSATLNMSYTMGDYSTVDVRFAYKISADPAWTYTSWVSKSAAGTHAAPVTGLGSNTQYDFRAELKYDSTEIRGSTLQFTTSTTPPVQVETATGGGTASFSSSMGNITSLTAVAEGTLPTAGKPAGVTFPHGLFSFNITNITPGSCVTVTITWPSAVAVGTTYWKYHASEGGWIQIPMGSDDGDNVTTITLCDGGLGDDDGVANGTIVDPGGPGVVIVGTVAAPAMPDGASTGGPAPARVTAPDLRPKYLSVNPKQVYANQPVNILTNVVNRGNMAGSYMVNLLINGQVEQRKTVSVSAGGTQPVRFTVTKAQPGTYTVAVGGDRARFTVIGAGLERSVGSANGPAVGLATFVLVLVAGLLLLVVRKRFQAG